MTHMDTVLLDTEKLGFSSRIKQSIFKPYFLLLKINLMLTLIAALMDAKYGLYFFSLTAIVWITIVLIRIPAYVNYIYKISINDKGKLLIQYESGIFVRKTLICEVEKGNFRVRYYRNPRYFPVFVLEQHRPYQLLMSQHCFGVWKEKASAEIFRNFASSITYYDFNNGEASPQSETHDN